MKPFDPLMIDKILNQYDQQKKIYTDFLERTTTLMREFIEPDGPKIHSIVGSIKEKDQLIAKLHNQKKNYNRLSDIPDIASIRIITYFEEEVRLISDIIRREFNVFPSPEQPKAVLTDPNRFGYVSSRFQVGLLDNRLELIEYRKFKGYLIELQIRSILQHAWLEINKHLGFQTKDLCPVHKQRDYGRVITLFELIDLELNKIKEFSCQQPITSPGTEAPPVVSETIQPLMDLPFTPLPIEAEPENDHPVNKTGPLLTPLLKNPTAQMITYEEMERLVLDNRLINTHDRNIADQYDTRLIYKEQSIITLTQACVLLDINHISQIEEAIKYYEKIIKPITNIIFGDSRTTRYEHISKGSSLLMVCYAISAKSGHTNTVYNFVSKHFFESDTKDTNQSVALIDCVQKFLNQ